MGRGCHPIVQLGRMSARTMMETYRSGSMAFDCPKQETIKQGTFGNDLFDK